jgi:hypothetical protein
MNKIEQIKTEFEKEIEQINLTIDNDKINEKLNNYITNNNEELFESGNYPELKKFIDNNKEKRELKIQLYDEAPEIIYQYYDYNKDISKLAYQCNFINNIDNIKRYIKKQNEYFSTLSVEQIQLIRDNMGSNLSEEQKREAWEIIDKSPTLEDNIYCYDILYNNEDIHKTYDYFYRLFLNLNHYDLNELKYHKILKVTIIKGSKALFIDSPDMSICIPIYSSFISDNKVISENYAGLYDIIPMKTINTTYVIIKNNTFLIKNISILDYLTYYDFIVDPAGLEYMQGEKLKGAGGASAAIYRYNTNNMFKENNVNNNSTDIIELDKKTIDHFNKFNMDNLYNSEEECVYYHAYQYGILKIIHAIGPDFNSTIFDKIKENKAEIYKIFYKIYHDIYKVFIRESNKKNENREEEKKLKYNLRLLPLSIGLFSNGDENKKIILKCFKEIYLKLNATYGITPTIYFYNKKEYDLFNKMIDINVNKCANSNDVKIIYDKKNSCYIDSLFYSLFNTRNKFIEEFLLKAPIIKYDYDRSNELYNLGIKIQQELNIIYDRINNNGVQDTCSLIRNLIQEYYEKNSKLTNIKEINEKLFTENQHEFTIILDQLEKIFYIPKLLKIEYKYVNPFDFQLNKKELLSFCYSFPSELFKSYEKKEELIIDNIFPKFTDIFDNVEYKFLQSPIFLITFDRCYDTTFLETKIIPSQKINFKYNSLYLNSIIIHRGNNCDSGHYTTLYQCNNIWYYYDDNSKKNKIIGDFKNIIEHENYTNRIIGLYYYYIDNDNSLKIIDFVDPDKKKVEILHMY